MKNIQCESYIKSDRFGLDTWMIIERLWINFSNMIATMELYQNMVKCDMHIQVKQHIMLDIIVKIMITPLTNTREVNLKIEINYEKPEIIQSLANNSVTNLWINPVPSTCDVMFKPDVEMNLQAYKTQ